MTTIQITDINEMFFIKDTQGGAYTFSGDDLISALALFVNTKEEMEEKND
jgi:hypothetical protein